MPWDWESEFLFAEDTNSRDKRRMREDETLYYREVKRERERGSFFFRIPR